MPDQGEERGAASSGEATGDALAPGTRVGDYVIVRLLENTTAGRTYLAQIAESGPDGDAAARPLEPIYRLIERPVGGHEGARVLLTLGLHHPHLLAPRAIVTWDRRDFLVVDAVPDEPSAAPPMDAAGILAAGVALADVLAYLHSNGVAHLHVGPAAVVVRGERVQLAGVEDGMRLHPLDPQAPPLFARDANFLARTLGVLAGVADGARTAGDAAATALAAIVERGANGAFRTAEEIGAACAAVVPRSAPPLPTPPAATTGGWLSFAVGRATSIGRVRTENQDATASAVLEVHDDLGAEEAATVPVGVFLIADGMGGEERGELASRIAARVAMTELMRELLPTVQLPVEAAVAGLARVEVALPSLAEVALRAGRAANSRVRQLASTIGRATGTTLTAVVAVGSHAALLHVGDSRAYLLRAGQLTQLSEDHTLLARMQAVNHPLLQDPAFAVPRSYLYRSLGQADEPELDIATFALSPGDRLLLCSDGLWDEVDSAQLLDLLGHATSPQECAAALVAAANAGSGRDNSSAVVVFVGSAPAAAAGIAGSAQQATGHDATGPSAS